MKKILVLLTLVSLIVCCCGAAMAEDHPDQIIREATCGKAGLKLVWDEKVGDYVTKPIDATGKHDFKDGVIAATCTENKKIGSFCSVCGLENPKVAAVEVEDSALGHKFNYDEDKLVTIKATCKEEGKIYAVCANCGEKDVIENLPIDTTENGHAWTVNTIFEEPNCKEKKDGSMKRTCKICGTVEYTTIAYDSDAAHKWDEGKVTKEATCTAEGEKTFTCSVCGGTKKEKIAKLAHDYQEMVYEATCYSNKKIGSVCSVCGEPNPKAQMLEISGTQLAHKWDGDYKEVKATCKTDSSSTRKCTLCGFVEEEPGYTVIKAGEAYHVWGNDEVMEAADCKKEQNGSLKQTCTVCGKAVKYSEIKWEDAHDWEEETIQAANCIEWGLKAKTCKVCNRVEYEEVEPTEEHNYQEVSLPADCLHPKMIGKVCIVCGAPDPDAEKAPIYEGVALGHTPDGVPVVKEATCCAPALVTYTCKRCGETIVTDVGGALDPDNHVMGEPTVLEAPDCLKQKNGSQKEVCTLCGEVVYSEIDWDEDGHVWDEEIVKEATCGDAGMTIKRCKVCGKFEIETTEPTGKHNFQETAFPADCTHDKVIGVVCTVCGTPDPEHVDETLIEEDTALGHDWDWRHWEETEPTCKEPGWSYMVCKRCGANSIGEFNEKGEPLFSMRPDYGWNPEEWHVWDEENAEVYEEATCTKEGSRKITCKVCKEVKYDPYYAPHAVNDDTDWVVVKKGNCDPFNYQDTLKKAVCKVCGEEILERFYTEHDFDYSYLNGKELRVCKVCGHTESDDHVDCVPGEPVKENVTATSYDEVIYCVVCGKELSRETKVPGTEPEPQPGEKPVYTTNFAFDADEMTLTGKATLTEGDAPKAVYARVTYFMADGTFVVVSVPVEADGTYESMNSGDVIHVSVQIVDSAKVRPGDFTSFSK
ncbi:MAG: hypothetical protein IKP72_07925 [Clostridia bacterium]|nr:hypothetical protein [Clostridia bacterium]